MEPIAISLDIFQGEKNCFLGVVLPTLFIMSDKIEKISHLKHCQHLKDTILNNFKIRFSYIIDLEKESSKIFIISAISHPKFKLSWIPNEYIDVCRRLFLEKCKYHGLQNENDECQSDISNSSHTTNNDFFSNYFEQISSSSIVDENEKNVGLVQGLLYLDSKNRSLNSLHKY